MSNLGIDLDGCLCQFNYSYARCLTERTGIAFPDFRKEDPAQWAWDRTAGVSKDDERWVWEECILNPKKKFWQNLLPTDGAPDTIRQLDRLSKNGHNVYYITSRPGSTAKKQSEEWLYSFGMDYPTVLISNDKLPTAQGLELDCLIDDKLETVNHILLNYMDYPYPKRTYLKHARYNEEGRFVGTMVVESVKEMLIREGLWV